MSSSPRWPTRAPPHARDPPVATPPTPPARAGSSSHPELISARRGASVALGLSGVVLRAPRGAVSDRDAQCFRRGLSAGALDLDDTARTYNTLTNGVARGRRACPVARAVVWFLVGGRGAAERSAQVSSALTPTRGGAFVSFSGSPVMRAGRGARAPLGAVALVAGASCSPRPSNYKTARRGADRERRPPTWTCLRSDADVPPSDADVPPSDVDVPRATWTCLRATWTCLRATRTTPPGDADVPRRRGRASGRRRRALDRRGRASGRCGRAFQRRDRRSPTDRADAPDDRRVVAGTAPDDRPEAGVSASVRTHPRAAA